MFLKKFERKNFFEERPGFGPLPPLNFSYFNSDRNIPKKTVHERKEKNHTGVVFEILHGYPRIASLG